VKHELPPPHLWHWTLWLSMLPWHVGSLLFPSPSESRNNIIQDSIAWGIVWLDSTLSSGFWGTSLVPQILRQVRSNSIVGSSWNSNKSSSWVLVRCSYHYWTPGRYKSGRQTWPRLTARHPLWHAWSCASPLTQPQRLWPPCQPWPSAWPEMSLGNHSH